MEAGRLIHHHQIRSALVYRWSSCSSLAPIPPLVLVAHHSIHHQHHAADCDRPDYRPVASLAIIHIYWTGERATGTHLAVRAMSR